VFEIGNSLREARLRQGFELPRVEADTKIRAKYLRALEEEHFEVLPGDTYVKGFLRTYAEYLGLDGQLYVDEYNSRFARDEEFPPMQSAGPRRRTPARRMESNFVVVALAGIVAVTILVVVAWKFGSSGNPTSPALLDGAGTTTTQGGTDTGAQTQPPATKPKPRSARLVLRATGDCWVRVRAGGASGELLYEGTLQQGQTQRFTKWKKLWLQLGAPAYLKATLNGHSANFPRSPAIVAVTARGVRTVSTA